MEETPAIVRLNLEHYEALLRLGLDEDKRHRVEALIQEAKAKLAASAKSVPDETGASGIGTPDLADWKPEQEY